METYLRGEELRFESCVTKVWQNSSNLNHKEVSRFMNPLSHSDVFVCVCVCVCVGVVTQSGWLSAPAVTNSRSLYMFSNLHFMLSDRCGFPVVVSCSCVALSLVPRVDFVFVDSRCCSSLVWIVYCSWFLSTPISAHHLRVAYQDPCVTSSSECLSPWPVFSSDRLK